jgi:tRNA(Ile)-lysidine synthase
LGLKCVSERGNVEKLAKQSRISIEMAARELRHEFLARTCLSLDIGTVALAHHADDQVELFFLRLLRGAGGEGLGGMGWEGTSPISSRIRLIRPLLGKTKQELREFAQEEGIKFAEDATNADADYLRNRIRNVLLPDLCKNYQPALMATTLRVMEIVGADAEFVHEIASAWLEERKRTAFGDLHLAVQRKVLQIQLLKLGMTPDFDLIERLRFSGGKPIMVAPECVISLGADGRITRVAIPDDAHRVEKLAADLSGNQGKFELNGLKIAWEKVLKPQMPKASDLENCEIFDAEKVGGEVVLRHWQPGDTFQPVGMKGPVKLQDLFTNLKIPRDKRRQLVVAVAVDGEIFWVESLRISERFKLSKETETGLKWQWGRD